MLKISIHDNAYMYQLYHLVPNMQQQHFVVHYFYLYNHNTIKRMYYIDQFLKNILHQYILRAYRIHRSRCASHSCRSRSEFARTMKDFFGLRINHANEFSKRNIYWNTKKGKKWKQFMFEFIDLPVESLSWSICISWRGIIVCCEY